MKNITVKLKTLKLNMTPLVFARNALHFLQSAFVLHKAERLSKKNSEKSFSPVPYFLYCKGFELAFKAIYLNKNPEAVNDIARIAKHDLKIALLKAQETLKKKIISKEDEVIIYQLGKHYGNNAKKERGFEYFTTNMKGSMLRGFSDIPKIDDIEKISQKIIKELEMIKYNSDVI